MTDQSMCVPGKCGQTCNMSGLDYPVEMKNGLKSQRSCNYESSEMQGFVFCWYKLIAESKVVS